MAAQNGCRATSGRSISFRATESIAMWELQMKYLAIVLVTLACTWPAQAQFAEPNDRGVSFGHMHLVVADLELHQRLWPELFGAELVEKQGYSAVRVEDALIFFRDAKPNAPSVETTMDHFGLKVRDIDDILSKWRAMGYEVDSRTTDASGHAIATITMPGGIRLALDEEPNHSAIASMGHVQFVTPMLGELIAWYEEYFGIKTFTQDDNGAAATVPGSELRFHSVEKSRLPTDGAAIDHIGFEIQEWDAFIEMLQGAGVQFEFGPAYIESLDLWVAFFNDPGGVLVEITHGLDQF